LQASAYQSAKTRSIQSPWESVKKSLPIQINRKML